jgi:hypothetical protein
VFNIEDEVSQFRTATVPSASRTNCESILTLSDPFSQESESAQQGTAAVRKAFKPCNNASNSPFVGEYLSSARFNIWEDTRRARPSRQDVAVTKLPQVSGPDSCNPVCISALGGNMLKWVPSTACPLTVETLLGILLSK